MAADLWPELANFARRSSLVFTFRLARRESLGSSVPARRLPKKAANAETQMKASEPGGTEWSAAPSYFALSR